ncbi:hypothetical protein, partial [Staphylococcus aureus]|uniref:hypothetical protein n=1 Tax=Staphylococcus aureus TaxID=1280 RepID=UPI001C93179D
LVQHDLLMMLKRECDRGYVQELGEYFGEVMVDGLEVVGKVGLKDMDFGYEFEDVDEVNDEDNNE